jgi:hypothetical protein
MPHGFRETCFDLRDQADAGIKRERTSASAWNAETIVGISTGTKIVMRMRIASTIHSLSPQSGMALVSISNDRARGLN